jgi:hypothetical protein
VTYITVGDRERLDVSPTCHQIFDMAHCGI